MPPFRVPALFMTMCLPGYSRPDHFGAKHGLRDGRSCHIRSPDYLSGTSLLRPLFLFEGWKRKDDSSEAVKAKKKSPAAVPDF
jgi:hypothetical protein